MKAFVFPGQGSQKMGMGENLFNEYKDLISKADEILGYSVKELCLEDPGGQLTQTQYTQPALFIVNALTYLKTIEEEDKPDYVAGHSLGEYNALFAAGAFDFETGVKLVQKRGELMSQASGGGMAAVIGFSKEKIEDVLKENNLSDIYIANYNSPSQIVISGPVDDVKNAQPVFESSGVQLYIPLKVSGAFHTVYMKEAEKEFKKFLDEIEFSEIKIPVISNVNAKPYKSNNIKTNLLKQITNSVMWTDSVIYLMGQGEIEFKEIGPGNVLTGLLRKIKKEAKSINKENIEKKNESKSTNSKSKTLNKSKVLNINSESLGSKEFKNDYNVKYAYVSGSMYRGISSKELVVKMAKADMLSYFGTGGLDLNEIEKAIKYIQAELNNDKSYGMNLLGNPLNPEKEDEVVDLFFNYNVKNIEASAFIDISSALIRFRLNGLTKNKKGETVIANKIMAKISRPEVAEKFLSPAPEKIVKILLEDGKVTQEQAELAKNIPMADDLCVEADSGGHTDQNSAYALLPSIMKLRDGVSKKYNYKKLIRIGAAGGIGTPEAAAASFILGADFILTGSINQCTVESGTSDLVKNLLENIDVQDTEYAPAGDMFEMGSKVQVLKKGLFFPIRANKLFELYQHYNSIDEIPEKIKKQLQEKYFKRSFSEVYELGKSFYSDYEIEKAENNSKYKMALIFKWYFAYSTDLALNGDEENKVNFQVHCGPALGAFNQWVKGTKLESWRYRHVDEIAKMIMDDTAKLLEARFQLLLGNN